jgi:chitodextrinase
VPISASPTSDTTVSVVWTASSDNVGVNAYRVSRDGIVVATLAAQMRQFSDGGRTAGQTYKYSVSAVDSAGNVGTPAEASATMPTPPDVVPPSAPTNLSASAIKGKKVALAWTPATDDVSVAGYRVYRNGTLVATVASTSFVDSSPGRGSAKYRVVAFDAAGNVSAPSNTATVG